MYSNNNAIYLIYEFFKESKTQIMVVIFQLNFKVIVKPNSLTIVKPMSLTLTLVGFQTHWFDNDPEIESKYYHHICVLFSLVDLYIEFTRWHYHSEYCSYYIS